MSTAVEIHEAGHIVADRARAFETLAHRLAMKEQVGAEEIADILRDAGQTSEQLKRSVQNIKERVGIRQMMAEIPLLEKRQTQLERLMAENDAEFAAATAKRNQVNGDLSCEYEQVLVKLSELRLLPRELMKSCPDTRLQREWAGLDKAEQDAANAERVAQRNLDRAISNQNEVPPADRWKLDKNVGQYQEALRAAHARSAALMQRRNTLRRQLIEY